ncbi:MAG: UvrD-helicase domain-containing protein [Nitrospira sp. BO4]|jgi:ATP-dependent helicase/nuclease subunit A|nr:UvrD-helicase domain-containing protein [Nitrospira sp. BO4]
MSNDFLIPDRLARESAETTFDRNVVVIAGAGTGKTTLLVNRLVYLLMKEPAPVPITQIVALTFTNKAATEMKVRLRERLTILAHPEAGSMRSTDGGVVSLDALRARYGLSADAVAARAQAGLNDLEKAQIGTLHSFAAHVLRLHPLESVVDPDFKEDDGLRFEEQFTAAWDCWLDQELSLAGQHHRVWRSVLSSTTLEAVRTLTRSLCSELVDLDALQHQLESTAVPPAMSRWIQQMDVQAEQLLKAYDRPKRRKVEHMLAATVSLMHLMTEKGLAGREDLTTEEREWLDKDLGNAVAGWEKADFREAGILIETAQQLLSVDHEFLTNLLKLVIPLVRNIRDAFARQGWISFDGLLARARALLFEHPSVRERIKRDYRAVLVDEFQDTDPVQYEIILAVSERQGNQAAHWREMVLEPGKLFIVGDPKQSIYAFRRADIEAFDLVVEKVTADGGVSQTLTTNFRSDAAVLEPVNEVFDRLFERRSLVQPANVRLEVRPQRRPASIEPGVRLCVTRPDSEDETFDAAGATRAESEVLVRWLAEEVLSRASMKPGCVALLFRKLTQADAYLDALRRHNIPYVIEGEKHFYRRQEVIDFVNLLRVLDHPHDEIAMAGLLRSPLGGLTDRDLYELKQAGQFDYLHAVRLETWPHGCASAVRRLFEHLAWLHRTIAVLPLVEAIELIFDRLPVLDLAAASLHGEQAVANLMKIKQTAAALADRPHMTLSGFVDLMIARLEEQPDESESPLAEESLEAVHVLTIHKAKGLEFPIVVLPGLHQGSGRERSTPQVSHDWSSGTYGLSLERYQSLGALLVHNKLRLREEAERRRVLYVGMTRAKELLLLSGGITARSVGETVFELLQNIGTGEIGAVSTEALKIGGSSIPHRVVAAPERKRPRRRLGKAGGGTLIDPHEIAELWKARTVRWKEACETPSHLTPTVLGKRVALIRGETTSVRPDAGVGRLAGVVAHRLLERWDFSQDPSGLLEQVVTAIQAALGPDDQSYAGAVAESVHDLLATFGRSEAYARLRSAQILGREVPFVIPWGDRQVMEGIIDLIYRLDGELWVADYKTDTVSPDQAAGRAELYRPQSEVYKVAVRQSLGVEAVRFHCLFLRCATVVEL